MATREIVAYQFGEFRVDLRTYRLTRREEVVRLEPKAFELLRYLIENSERVVEKNELLGSIWKDSFVTENALTRVVAQIRKQLGAGERDAYIETVQKRGYRFAAPVEAVVAGDDTHTQASVLAPPTHGFPEPLDSVAVLPFENAGGDPEAEYLSDGLAESLIHALSRLGTVRVTARSTVFRYKGSPVDPIAIGRELGVGAVVVGRIVALADVLALTVELVDVTSGAQVWGTRQERTRSELLAAEAEIASELHLALDRRTAPRDAIARRARATDNPRAYEAYLRGRHAWNQKTLEGLRRSIEFFERAIVEDPRFARAHAGLADAYSWLGTSGYVRPRDVFPRAKDEALLAVELDPDSAEAYTSLAAARVNWDWDWSSASRELDMAVSLDPRYAAAYTVRSQYCTIVGRPSDAIAEAERAREIEPLGRAANLALGWAYYFARRFDAAAHQFAATLELRPDLTPALYGLGESYEGLGRLDDALAVIERAKRSAGDAPSASLAYVYSLAGRWTEALLELDALLDLSTREYVSPFYVAVIYSGLGHRERALDWLERALAERSGTIAAIRASPRFDSLRAEPRFERLVERIERGG